MSDVVSEHGNEAVGTPTRALVPYRVGTGGDSTWGFAPHTARRAAITLEPGGRVLTFATASESMSRQVCVHVDAYDSSASPLAEHVPRVDTIARQHAILDYPPTGPHQPAPPTDWGSAQRWDVLWRDAQLDAA